jgi:hypothetical protein
LKAIGNGTNLAMIDIPRMRNILEKLVGYNFMVDWNAGKSHCIADALSRSPVLDPVPSNDIFCQKISSDTLSCIPNLNFLAFTSEAVKDNAY